MCDSRIRWRAGGRADPSVPRPQPGCGAEPFRAANPTRGAFLQRVDLTFHPLQKERGREPLSFLALN